MSTNKYEVRFTLPASAGIAKTRKVEVDVDATLGKTQALSKALHTAAMKLNAEGITHWSLDTIVQATN